MKINQITKYDLENILDNHIQQKRDCMFVCNGFIAYFISEFLEEVYDIRDEGSELFSNAKEFYVSLNFYDNYIEFFCEDACGIDGEFKGCDLDNQDYFIQGNMMSDREIEECLYGGEDCTWSRFELVEDDGIVEEEELEEDMVEECCGCCECCCEDEGIGYDDLLDIFTYKILETQGCPGCIRDILDEAFSLFIPDEDE